jgi:hypothetical protein
LLTATRTPLGILGNLGSLFQDAVKRTQGERNRRRLVKLLLAQMSLKAPGFSSEIARAPYNTKSIERGRRKVPEGK